MYSTRLPESEFELMEVIWGMDGPATTPMLMERLGKMRGWKIQTLATLLKRLTERGFLSVRKGGGRELEYRPLISRKAYQANETRQFVEKLHMGSFVSLISSLSGQLSGEELDELEMFVKNAKEEQEK